MPAAFSWPLFDRLPLVGILRGFKVDEVREIVRAARAGGLTTIEITLNSPEPERAIEAALEEAGGGMNVGAGTIRTVEDYERAKAAGASFVVTPVVVPEVIRSAKRDGLTVIPGALSPTEIFNGWFLGGDLVKVFPAGRLGPKYIDDLRGPLPEVRLLPTGGIKAEAIPDYVHAGAAGFGLGGPLFSRRLVAARDWEGIRRAVERFRAIWEEAAGRT